MTSIWCQRRSCLFCGRKCLPQSTESETHTYILIHFNFNLAQPSIGVIKTVKIQQETQNPLIMWSIWKVGLRCLLPVKIQLPCSANCPQPPYIRRPRQTQGGVRKGRRVYDTAASVANSCSSRSRSSAAATTKVAAEQLTAGAGQEGPPEVT